MDSGRRRRLTDRSRRRVGLGVVEALEQRLVMSYSPLGYSLPDLSVIGFAGPSAAYGGQIGVTAQVTNLGASSIIEPLNQAPGSPSSADAGPSTVNVYLSPTPKLANNSILIGQLAIPSISQNNTIQVSATLTLPASPSRYPAIGHNAFIIFVADSTQAVREIDETNNSAKPVPVKITPNLPDLKTYALDVPPTIQPGDTIQPNIRIANVGSADTSPQGPVTVLLVASLDKSFGTGASVIGRYTIDNIPASALTPTKNFVLGDVNLDPPPYIRTISGAIATVPTQPGKYYIGVVIDPNNTIRELSEYGKPGSAHTTLNFPQVVKTVPGLPPAGVISTPVIAAFPFPISSTTQGTTPGISIITTNLAGSLGSATASGVRSTASAGGETGPTIGRRQGAAVIGNGRKQRQPIAVNTGSSLATISQQVGPGPQSNPADLVVIAGKGLFINQPVVSSLSGPLTFATTT